jgi:tyrosyl-tRNA synthetase
LKVLDVCTKTDISKSNGEVKKLIQSAAIYVNEIKVEDSQKTFVDTDFVNGFLLVRK